MIGSKDLSLARAANAFSSFAVTIVLAALTVLALAMGSMQDTKAETNAGLLLQRTPVEDASFVWSEAGVSLPERRQADAATPVISRQPLRATRNWESRSGVAPSPTQDWMGVSKVAFPLVVGDLAGDRPLAIPTVMRGTTVGVK